MDLGNLAAATDSATLRAKNIKYILTLDSCQLPDTIVDEIKGTIQNKYVEGIIYVLLNTKIVIYC